MGVVNHILTCLADPGHAKGPAAILDYYPRILLISFSGISTSFAISA